MVHVILVVNVFEYLNKSLFLYIHYTDSRDGWFKCKFLLFSFIDEV